MGKPPPTKANWARKGRRRRRGKTRMGTYDPHYFTPASAVKVTKADGTTFTEKPLTPKQLQALLKTRQTITVSKRQKVLKRDQGCCRYCGTDVGPFQIDHVVPVAMGGTSAIKNLVTACTPCNSRKRAQVWTPKPIGWKPKKTG